MIILTTAPIKHLICRRPSISVFNALSNKSTLAIVVAILSDIGYA